MRGVTETVTIWHKTRNQDTRLDEWMRQVIPGCSWEADIIRSVSGTTASIASAFTVLIPIERGAVVAPGDLVAKGECSTDITGIAPNTEPSVRASLLPDVFDVKTVYDGSAGYKRGKHIEVTGA